MNTFYVRLWKVGKVGIYPPDAQHHLMIRLLTVLGVSISLLSCKSTYDSSKNYFSLKDDSVNLYAFIGEKISVTEFDPNENNVTIVGIDSVTGDTIRRVRYVMDEGFKCKYKVIRNIFNQLENDTIEFEAFDHYGRPAFENHEYVILYLSRRENGSGYYHQKYLFDPVQITSEGVWRGTEGESIEKLFIKQKNGFLTARGVFD